MDKHKIKGQALPARAPLFNSMQEDEPDRIALGTTELRLECGQKIAARGPSRGRQIRLLDAAGLRSNAG
jgi:hypothetical protein